MTTIKFKDNTEVEALVVNASTQFVQGTNRDVLEFVFIAEGNSMDELSTLFGAAEKIERITLINGEEEFIYSGYVVPTSKSISLVNELVTPETNESPATYEKRIKIELAQQTYAEKLVTMNTENIERLRVETAESNAELFEMLFMSQM